MGIGYLLTVVRHRKEWRRRRRRRNRGEKNKNLNKRSLYLRYTRIEINCTVKMCIL